MAVAKEPAPSGDSFEAHGLGWRAVMLDRTCRITVRRLRRDGGSLKGYVDVEYKAPGRGTPRERLAGEVLNLSSGRDRAGFANRLLERKPSIEWRNIVDAFCVEVERRDDEAEPAVLIGNLPAPIDGGWLVDGLLERNQNNEIHGDGSVGKSWLGLALAVSVTTGIEILPGYRPHQRGPVLYLDWETDQDTLNARVQQIARGAGITYPDIWYLRMDGPLSDAVERVLALCQENGIILIVVDSIEAAMAGSISAGAPSNEGPSRMNRALRRIGLTAFLIDHISSEQAQSEKIATKAYGSIFKRNWIRRSFHLKQTHEPAADGFRHLGLFIAKVNNGKEPPPVGLRWEVNDEVCRWDREEMDDPELEQALPLVDRIAGYIRREGPSQLSAIVEAMAPAKRTTVTSTLQRQTKRFYKDGRGLWDVLVEPPAPAEDADYGDPDPLPWPDAGDADA
ncbi:MAG TPA: AAA family ATPase [Candidatus Saccharimonadia bacterium]|nr:AAA family ATPase [Candidatus Saccharimonadia bacterium]